MVCKFINLCLDKNLQESSIEGCKIGKRLKCVIILYFFIVSSFSTIIINFTFFSYISLFYQKYGQSSFGMVEGWGRGRELKEPTTIAK